MPDEDQGQEQSGAEDLELSTEEVREAFPEAVVEIETEAREEERERIRAIYEIDVPDSYEDAKAEGMFDPEATRDSVASEILQRQSAKRQAALDARRSDEKELDAPDPGTGAEEDMEAQDLEVEKTLAAAQKAGVLPVAS